MTANVKYLDSVSELWNSAILNFLKTKYLQNF